MILEKHTMCENIFIFFFLSKIHFLYQNFSPKLCYDNNAVRFKKNLATPSHIVIYTTRGFVVMVRGLQLPYNLQYKAGNYTRLYGIRAINTRHLVLDNVIMIALSFKTVWTRIR